MSEVGAPGAGAPAPAPSPSVRPDRQRAAPPPNPVRRPARRRRMARPAPASRHLARRSARSTTPSRWRTSGRPRKPPPRRSQSRSAAKRQGQARGQGGRPRAASPRERGEGGRFVSSQNEPAAQPEGGQRLCRMAPRPPPTAARAIHPGGQGRLGQYVPTASRLKPIERSANSKPASTSIDRTPRPTSRPRSGTRWPGRAARRCPRHWPTTSRIEGRGRVRQHPAQAAGHRAGARTAAASTPQQYASHILNQPLPPQDQREAEQRLDHQSACERETRRARATGGPSGIAEHQYNEINGSVKEFARERPRFDELSLDHRQLI